MLNRKFHLLVPLLIVLLSFQGCGLQGLFEANTNDLPDHAALLNAEEQKDLPDEGVFASHASLQNGVNEPEYDLIIINGRVIDPETGRDEIANVAVKDGVISKISTDPDSVRSGAVRVIDAAGLVVAPGFINTHTHEGKVKGLITLDFLEDCTRYYVQDGITFWLGGDCGMSPTGVNILADEDTTRIWGMYQQPMREFFNEAEKLDLYNNCGFKSGNMTLRSHMGLRQGESENEEQIRQMQAILADDLQAGSFGISYGLMYDMGASREAGMALAQTSYDHGGMAASHVRYPIWNLNHLLLGKDLILFKDAIYEAIEKCRDTQVPFIVSHITDQAQSDSSAWVFEVIDEAIREEGLPLAGDIIGHDFLMNDAYILTFNGRAPIALMFIIGGYKPSQFYAGRDFYINGELFAEKYEQLNYWQLEYLRMRMKDVDLPYGEKSLSIPVICEIIPPKDTKLGLQYPWCFIGNDASLGADPLTGDIITPHPRALGTFSQLLGRWTRDEEAISLHQALFKASFAPAFWLGLDTKGRMQEGCDADITIFDPQTVRHLAEWVGDTQELAPEGINYVIVNGQVVVEEGELTGATPGKLIRRTWRVPGNTTELIAIYDQLFKDE